MSINSFTINDTNFAKGIAICLLLVHHLFYDQSSQYMDILVNGRQLSNIISEFSKVCVAMFVLLSGYGLNASTNNNLDTIHFYKNKLTKLYLNYWFIWIVFVPIGILFFGRTFEIVYPDKTLISIFLNILGIQNYFKFYGYNATWWFMSVIISLYILFPLLKLLTFKFKKWVLLLSFVFIFIHAAPVTLRLWLFPFVLGIYCSQNKVFERIVASMPSKPIIKLLIYITAIGTVMVMRYKLKNVIIDGFFALLIIQIGYEYLSKISVVRRAMIVIGRHSLNIFLFHSFIYYYYLKDFSYILRFPPLIFLQLLLISIAISIILEKIKSLIYFESLQNRICRQSKDRTV